MDYPQRLGHCCFEQHALFRAGQHVRLFRWLNLIAIAATTEASHLVENTATTHAETPMLILQRRFEVNQLQNQCGINGGAGNRCQEKSSIHDKRVSACF